MNIKLDQKTRIRLSEDDVALWKSNQRLFQSFKLGPIELQVLIEIDSEASQSQVSFEKHKLVIALTAEDSERLISGSESVEGITVGEIEMQVDRWNKEKRMRMEKHQSSRNLG